MGFNIRILPHRDRNFHQLASLLGGGSKIDLHVEGGKGAKFIGSPPDPLAPAADQPGTLQLGCMYTDHRAAQLQSLRHFLDAPLPFLEQADHPQADLAGQRLIYRQGFTVCRQLHG
ncbi:hypothetical protein D3C76_1205930 [compost metagenome]